MKYVEIRLKYIEKVYVTDRGVQTTERIQLGGYHFDGSKKFGKKYGNHLADHTDFPDKPGMVYGFLSPQRSRKIYYNEHYDRMHGGNSKC